MRTKGDDQGGDAEPTGVEKEWVSVSFSGDLDVSTAGEMRARLAQSEVLDARGVQVDLSQVTFLDSSSIGVLVAACKRIRNDGGLFSVVCGEGPVRRTLVVAGLLDYLDARGPS
jgi:anti-sigma B factor antagonist